jgi:SIR2-like domain
MPQLVSLLGGGDAVVFCGAGISKPPPASAPVWPELQRGFISAIYERLREQGWLVNSGVLEDAEILENFRFRPEVFWDTIQRAASLATVQRAFEVLHSGSPNLNHRMLARLLACRRLSALVTTNFDEYLEQGIPVEVPRVTGPEAASRLASGDQTRCLLKLHGTLSAPESLRFTLAHIDVLAPPLAELLRRVVHGRQLLVVAYSGWDEDILPELAQAVTESAGTVVVVYPGSRPDEPVRQLAAVGAAILEADIADPIRTLAENEVAAGRAPRALLEGGHPPSAEPADHYHGALEAVELVVAAMMLSDLHELSGNAGGALRYAGLAIDICEDERYAGVSRPYINAALERVRSAESVLGLGDTYFRYHEARVEAPASSTWIDRQSLIEAVDDRLRHAGALVRQESLGTDDERDIEAVVTVTLDGVDRGVLDAAAVRPHALYLLAKLRARQDRWIESLNAYLVAMPFDVKVFGHVGAASMYLDAGVSAMHVSRVASDDAAPTVYGLAVSLSERAHELADIAQDHLTAAKAAMNLARLRFWNDEHDRVPPLIEDARAHAERSGDPDLRVRLEALSAELRAS